VFKKLVSNLPFNPSLIDQVAFYAKRLHKDALARRLGFIMMCLVMLVQMYAVISPPQPTLAQSANDVILGGISSADDAARLCQNNSGGFKDILERLDITCDNLAASTETTIDSKAYDGKLMTVGRLAYGKTGETPLGVKGKTVWMRPLKHWDHGSSKHQALEGTSRTGKKFYIVKSCGGVTVVDPPPAPAPKCEWNQSILASDPRCFQACPVGGKESIAKNDANCFEPCPYESTGYGGSANDPECFEPCPFANKQSIARSSAQCFDPCQYNSEISSDDPSCQPCEASFSSDNQTACLLLSKVVRNDTQGQKDANNRTAKPGDTLTYSLSVTNRGSQKVDSFIVQENISDTLDYAVVSNRNGASVDDKGVLAWAATAIEPGQTIAREFSVTVKDKLPNTPRSASDPNHFDLTMTNVYGNSVSITLPASTIKVVEAATTTLPSTGPGSSLLIGFVGTTVIGYFFARSRLLAKELVIIKQDYSASGGL
jgi:uncharacterized repeat protein (TIGR01451 family)